MTQTDYLKQLETRVLALRAKGLSDLKFATGQVSESTPNGFAKEACAMLDAIDAGKAKPLHFNDAKYKGEC